MHVTYIRLIKIPFSGQNSRHAKMKYTCTNSFSFDVKEVKFNLKSVAVFIKRLSIT